MPTFIPSVLVPQGRPRPLLQASRNNDDWSFLRYEKRSDPWDNIKFVPLDRGTTSYLSVGGEARETYEFFRNAGFGRGVQNPNGYLLERYRLALDLHLKSGRAFIELNQSSVEGRRGGARPSDQNRLDYYQAFLEPIHGVRIGRQELFFGSGRMFALKEGGNVPISFEGVRIGAHRSGWRTDLFAVKPVTPKFGSFDDRPADDQRLWGAYATFGTKSPLDAYYIARDKDRASFGASTQHEVRHSFGIRNAGHIGRLSRDYEAIFQTGSFGGDPVSAYRLSFDTFYELAGPHHWKFGLRLDKGSGDGDPKDHHLHTYDGFFQSGSYSGKPGLLGPANEIDLEPSVAWIPKPNWTASAAIGFLWRASDADATYLINGSPDRVAPANNAKYVGSRTTLSLSWQKDRHLSYNLNYIYVVPGAFYRQTGASDNETYMAWWATYRF